jgi:uncharacterized protein
MRLLTWRGVDEWLAESATVELSEGGLRATGIQIGAHPAPYRLEYRLDATDGFVTRALDLTATEEGETRRLSLRHDGSGGWAAEGDQVELPDLSEARDIDIAFSPLTNSMPILRHGLHRDQGERDFTMAWVEVPSLRVIASRQRYEHVRAADDGAVVRFLDGESNFIAELELDRDGLLVFYPQLARRVAAEEMAAGTG